MKSYEECKNLFNIKFIQGDIFPPEIPLWANEKEKFEPLMENRQAIIDWLTRILLNYSFPPTRDARNPMRESMEPNLTSLFKSIQFLISLGYPPHWFSLFMQDVLSNNLSSKESYPKKSPNTHSQLSEKKKLDLSPILLELSILTTLYGPALGIGNF